MWDPFDTEDCFFQIKVLEIENGLHFQIYPTGCPWAFVSIGYWHNGNYLVSSIIPYPNCVPFMIQWGETPYGAPTTSEYISDSIPYEGCMFGSVEDRPNDPVTCGGAMGWLGQRAPWGQELKDWTSVESFSAFSVLLSSSISFSCSVLRTITKFCLPPLLSWYKSIKTCT